MKHGKKAEEALRISEEKYRSLFNSIDEGYLLAEVIFDKKGRPVDILYLEANPTAIRLAGRDFTGRRMREIDPNYEDYWLEIYCHVALTGEPMRAEHYAEPHRRWFEFYAFKVGSQEDRRVATIFQDITERKQAEEVLRDSERKLSEANRQKEDILESISDCFYALDKDLRFTYVNKAAEEIWGLSRADILGRKIEDVFVGQIDFSLSKFHQVLEEQAPQHYQIYSKVIKRWGEMSVYPSQDGLSVYFQDITDRKRAEEALKESEERFKSLSEATPIGAGFSTMDGVLRYTNPAFERIVGYEPGEMIGKKASDIWWNAEDRVAWLDIMKKNGVVRDFQAKLRKKDGTAIWGSMGGEPILTGNEPGVMGTIQDITERKKAEEELSKYQDHLHELVEERTAELEEMNIALKESESKYRFLTEKMSDIVWTTDMNLKITYVSPSIERLRGITPEERMQMKLNEVLTPGSYMRAMEVLQRETDRYKEKGFDPGRSVNLELEFYRKDGSIIWMDTVVTFITDGAGTITGVHGVGRDITERKRTEAERKDLENQLMHMQKIEALNRFAGGIAHDLNNILFPIIVDTEHLLSEAPTGSERYEILNQILKASYRQRDIIKQILTLSRKHIENLIPMKIGPLVEESIGFLHSSLPSTIKIDYRAHAKDDVILGDSTQIQQVILNLCQNAADSIGSRTGRIEISLTDIHLKSLAGFPDIQAGEYVQLTVKDTGSGMSKDVMNRAFDPFFSTKSVDKGSGMGLSVAYGIIKGHKGAITVKSTEGKGSLFTVYLPVCDEQCQAMACLVERKTSNQGKGKILLIDDEESILTTLERALKASGYQVVALRDGITALELFEKMHNDFDLVITDLTMPGMTGLDLSRKITNIRSDIPIILCTGFSDVIDRDKVRSIGIRELLLKPAGIRDLKDTIRRALEN